MRQASLGDCAIQRCPTGCRGQERSSSARNTKYQSPQLRLVADICTWCALFIVLLSFPASAASPATTFLPTVVTFCSGCFGIIIYYGSRSGFIVCNGSDGLKQPHLVSRLPVVAFEAAATVRHCVGVCCGRRHVVVICNDCCGDSSAIVYCGLCPC